MRAGAQQARIGRLEHTEHAGDQDQRTDGRERHTAMRVVAGQGQHDRQEDPYRGIVDHGRAQRQAAGRRPRHVAVLEDACQHRKCRHRHRRGNEQRERPEADALRCEAREQPRRGSQTEQQRQHDAGHAHQDRGTHLRLGAFRRTQFHADHEHEKHHAHRGQAGQRRQGFGGEQRRVQVGQPGTECDRTEQQPGRHFADDRRLPNALQQRTAQARSAQDHRQLHQQQRGLIHRLSIPVVESARPSRPAGHRPVPPDRRHSDAPHALAASLCVTTRCDHVGDRHAQAMRLK